MRKLNKNRENIINIRCLERKEAPYMLEWMHDESVIKYMNTDFSSMTVDDCISFIQDSKDGTHNLHLAIVDSNDEYQGTVSLKDIDYEKKQAEFAIAIRRCAMGKGFSSAAMKMIIDYGFEKIDLNRIYWYVSPDNVRALKFYDKNGYERTICFNQTCDEKKYVWYLIEKCPNQTHKMM